MKDWIQKNGYRTKLLASQDDMDSDAVEIQLIRIISPKPDHHHKKKTELFYFLTDGGLFVVDGEKYEIKKGLTVVVKPNSVHSFDPEGSEYIEAIQIKTNNEESDSFS